LSLLCTRSVLVTLYKIPKDMGISLMQWRVRTGTFCGGKHVVLKSAAILRHHSRILFFAVLIISISLLIITAWDIESNPGPSENVRSSRSQSQSKLNFTCEMGDYSPTSLWLYKTLYKFSIVTPFTPSYGDKIQ